MNTAGYQDVGLIFRKEQLRFVSCHKEQAYWMTPLKELLVVFDIPIWILLVILSTLAANLFPYVSQQARNPSSLYYSMFALMLDQSTDLYSNKTFREKIAFWLVFALFPFRLIILSNLYKGENISGLTLGPVLVPFDTFDSLVQNNFKTFSRRRTLSKSDLSVMKLYFDVELEFGQVTRHEAMPFVSELWHEIMLSEEVKNWRKISSLQKVLSRSTWRFIENSEMFPVWNLSNAYHFQYVDQILEFHMHKCDKSAMILLKPDAIHLYTILNIYKKNVYFGKDIINENLEGYSYFGSFPTKLIWNSKYYFQSGIVKWWAEFFEWSITTKSNMEKIKNKYKIAQNKTLSFDYQTQSGVYVLCCIPIFGWFVSIITFICIDLIIGKHGRRLGKAEIRLCN